MLLNSHGHVDHLGNNDVLQEIADGKARRHHIPAAARPALDFEAFFGAMYRRGLPYFDYASGLSVPANQIASLLRALGAPNDLTDDDVAELGTRISALGLGPAISGFLPSIVVDILLQTYPPVFISAETMVDYEEVAPATDIRIGDTIWTGWTFGDDQRRPEVQVLQSCHRSRRLMTYCHPSGPRLATEVAAWEMIKASWPDCMTSCGAPT